MRSELKGNNKIVLNNSYNMRKVKKATPAQAWTDPRGLQMVETPRICGQLVVSPTPHAIPLLLVSVTGQADTGAIMWPEGLVNEKPL
jgi:hypothetical protein